MAKHKQIEYKQLRKDHFNFGGYFWFLDGERVEVKFGRTSVIEPMKVLGKEGWKLVLEEKDEGYVVMREVPEDN